MDRNKIQEVHILVDEKHPDSDMTPYITVNGLNDLLLEEPSARIVSMAVKTPGARYFYNEGGDSVGVKSEVYVVIEQDRDDDGGL